MKSTMKFGSNKIVLTGVGRARRLALFDYSKVAAGHLVGKLTSAEINAGRLFNTLSLRQNDLIRKWMNATTGYKVRIAPVAPAREDRYFPTEKEVLHQFLIWSQAPGGLTTNEDGDLSHTEVTKWYVAKYCRDNHLTM